MRLATGISIFQYIYAYEFAEWVEFTFGVEKNKAYQKLLENDYCEGRLGCRYSKNSENDSEIANWYIKFLEEFELEEIQLKYGG